MRRLIVVLVVLAVLVIGVGFNRGWFVLSSPNANTGSNKVNVNLTVDGEKIEDDAEALKNKAKELTGTGDDEVNSRNP